MRRSDVCYARGNDADLAYRVIEGDGRGAHDVVLVLSGTMPMDALFDDPVALRFLEGLADLGRLLLFDRAGIGLSDPPADTEPLTFALWCDDLDAVVAAAEFRRPVVVSNRIGGSVALVYADRHPEQVTSLVLVDPTETTGIDPTFIRAQLAGEVDTLLYMCPSRADEPGFREWFERAGRSGASPRMAQRAYPVITDDVRESMARAAAGVRVPTVVLRRPANPLTPDHSDDEVLMRVPTAIRIDLPGEDVFTFGGEVDALLAEISRFVTGEHRLPEPERLVAAVLFSDLVASTDRASALGDANWKRVLNRHDEIGRACVARRGGTVIKTTGDGILAVLPSATNAFLAARELRAALREEGLEIRVGIHVGDLDRRGDDISGLGVNIAARINAVAATGEILASSIAVGAAIGAPVEFEARGEHQLKGVPGTWPLFACIS